MVGSIAIDCGINHLKTEPFQIRTLKCSDFEVFGIQMLGIPAPTIKVEKHKDWLCGVPRKSEVRTGLIWRDIRLA